MKKGYYFEFAPIVVVISCITCGSILLSTGNMGTKASDVESVSITGGSCLRDGIPSRTVCSSSCGGSMKVQVLTSGETGSTSENIKCNTGYSCEYDGYGSNACGG